MSYDNPQILLLLFLFVIFVPLAVIRYRKKRHEAALFASAAPGSERGKLLAELRLRLILAEVFFLLFVCFLIIALAGPRWGHRIVPDYRRGLDIVLAFDLSRSMEVRDCPPFSSAEGENISRLERGIGIARHLVSASGDLRYASAIGRGRGVLAVPLTYDSETILAFLYGLNTQSISGRGTNLESLIDAAAGAFQDAFPSRRVIILLSDGEYLSGSFQAAVERARRAGISLISVGLGSEAGGPVPDYTIDGEPVISRLYANALRIGAERTGGIYINGSSHDAALLLAGHVNSLYAESRLRGHRREATPRWLIFILAALASFAMMRIMGVRRKEPHKPSGQEAGKSRIILTGLLCLLLFSSCARNQARLLIMEGNFFSSRGLYTEAISSYLRAMNFEEAAPYAKFALGAVYFTLDEGQAALERYTAAKRLLLEMGQEGHTELTFRLFYNSGIIYFERGEYDEAVRAFRQALRIDGSRIEAKRNLELSLISFERSASPQAASSQEMAESAGEASSLSASIILEYLREREQEHWRNREWDGESDFSGPDF